MGVFTLKKHFSITYNIDYADDKINIGSGYVGNLICICRDGSIIPNRTFDVGTKPGVLTDLYKALISDPAKTIEIAFTEDTECPGELKPVYTYKDGKVVSQKCVEYGYPNNTTDGSLMYENTHFKTRKEARAKAIQDARLGVKSYVRISKERFSDAFKMLYQLLAHYFYFLRAISRL